jgi:hypothetical protein
VREEKFEFSFQPWQGRVIDQTSTTPAVHYLLNDPSVSQEQTRDSAWLERSLVHGLGLAFFSFSSKGPSEGFAPPSHPSQGWILLLDQPRQFNNAFWKPLKRLICRWGIKWVRMNLNHHTPPCQGGVTTELDHVPSGAFHSSLTWPSLHSSLLSILERSSTMASIVSHGAPNRSRHIIPLVGSEGFEPPYRPPQGRRMDHHPNKKNLVSSR